MENILILLGIDKAEILRDSFVKITILSFAATIEHEKPVKSR